MAEADLLDRIRRGRLPAWELAALIASDALTPALTAALVARGDLTMPSPPPAAPPQPHPALAAALAPALRDPPFTAPFPSVLTDMGGYGPAGLGPVPKGLVVVPGALLPGYGSAYDDATAINYALGRSPVVYLLPAPYNLFSPVAPVSGNTLRGLAPVNQSGDSPAAYGTILRINAGFTSSLNTSAAVVLDAGTSGTVARVTVEDAWIDGTNAPAGVHGIASYNTVNSLTIRNMGIYRVPGNGIFTATPNSTPDGWTLDTVIVQGAGNSGVSANLTDATVRNVHCQSSGTFGFICGSGGNVRFIGCRADLNGNDGFRFDVVGGGGGFLDGVTLAACGSQRNQQHGCNIINSSAAGNGTRAPVTMVGCTWNGDGVNGGAGGGNFAGVRVAGAVVLVAAESCVLVHTEDVAGGCPNFALRTDALGTAPGKPQLLRWDGGFLNAASATIVSDAAPAAVRAIASHGVASGQYTGASTVVAVT